MPLFTLFGTVPAYAADPFASADITVTENVLADNVEPIGANLTTIAGGTNFAINNHVWNSGFEPMVVRKFIRIDRGGDNWFEWDSFGGPGYCNLAWTGLLNGATVRFYRIVDANGDPLSYSGGTDMNATAGADHVVFLGESQIPMPSTEHPDGGYIANDDRDGEADNGTYNVAWNAGTGNGPDATIAQSLYWAYKTGDSPANRAVPYLTCLEEYTEEEWMALVESLGVPYNPGVDTPQTKPYAYLRY